MTTFQFRAVTADGKTRTGALNAENPRAAAAELKRQGLIPVRIDLEAEPSGGLSGLLTNRAVSLPGMSRVRSRDVRFFTQEMSTLLAAGVPLDRALEIVSELTERPEARQVILDVLRVLKGGRSLADALETHPKVFSELYINMVRAGEAGGSLALVFDRMTEYERSRDELRGYIVSATVYPALLAFVGLASIFVLLYYVVPRFATMFEDGRMRIPLPTQIMLMASSLARDYGLIFLAGLAAMALGFYYYVQSPKGRAWWHAFQLRVPLAGATVRKAETARFARAMSTLIANGVPLVKSLTIAGRILTNSRIARSLDGVMQGVKRGEGIAKPLGRTGEFPPLAGHLLAVGEETGRLDEMFTRMADIYDTETRDSVKRFTSLFEPLLILVMGIVVGALILSMLLAITSINEVAI